MNRFVLFLATLGPIGSKFPAPGTLGSLVGVIVYATLALFFQWSPAVIGLCFLLLFILGIPLCSRAEILLDRNDPGEVIWDEFTVIPFIFLPLHNFLIAGSTHQICFLLVMGFALFRFFDITKPWIIRSAQKLPGGLGVMIDDLLAAIATAVTLWIAKTFSLSFFS